MTFAPRLEIYLGNRNNLCISTVKNKNAEPRLLVDVPLDELKALGSEDAAHRIGGTILNVLALWHKQAFEDWQKLAVRDSEVVVRGESHDSDDEYCSALRLIGQALSAKTALHNPSIEYFLKQAAKDNEDARKYLEDVWPMLRDRLEGQ